MKIFLHWIVLFFALCLTGIMAGAQSTLEAALEELATTSDVNVVQTRDSTVHRSAWKQRLSRIYRQPNMGLRDSGTMADS